MEKRTKVYQETSGKSANIYELNLDDCNLIKSLLDNERFKLIESYGQDVYKVNEYNRLVVLTRQINGLITEFLEDDRKEFCKFDEAIVKQKIDKE